jgi:hypothetical protein
LLKIAAAIFRHSGGFGEITDGATRSGGETRISVEL